MSTRFSYVKYDQESAARSEDFKKAFEVLEEKVQAGLPEGREKSLVITKLEEGFMWVGKAIRDEQIKRNSQPEHVPERTNQ